MNPQSLVTNLELSKKLQELGVPQKSLFYWKKYFVNGEERIEPQMNVPEDYPQRCSAFTSGELGKLLPNYYEAGHVFKTDEAGVWWFDTRKNDKGNWVVGYECEDLDDGVWFHDDTEANARAKMLIYLIENRLITL